MTAQFARFAVIGGIGFVVDAGGTWLLVHLGVTPYLARVPAMLVAILTTWLLNRRHTFRVDRAAGRGELARYVAVAATSALLNFLLYSGLVMLGIHPVIAVVMATAVLMLFSFFAYRELAFR